MSTDRKLGLNRLISISTILLLLLSPYFSHSHKVSLSSLSLSVCLSLSSLSHTIFLSLPSTFSVSPSLCLSSEHLHAFRSPKPQQKVRSSLTRTNSLPIGKPQTLTCATLTGLLTGPPGRPVSHATLST